jgi:hypothetical protein
MSLNRFYRSVLTKGQSVLCLSKSLSSTSHQLNESIGDVLGCVKHESERKCVGMNYYLRGLKELSWYDYCNILH